LEAVSNIRLGICGLRRFLIIVGSAHACKGPWPFDPMKK